MVPETGNHFRKYDKAEIMLERYPVTMPQVTDGAIAESPLDQREYECFKACLPTWRDVLIAKVLRATGLRVMELLRLESRHYAVTGPEFSILVRRSKRRSKRAGEYERVYLPPALGVEMRDYIAGNRLGAEARVFPITDRQVRYVFAAAGEKGIDRPVHPHELRHLFVKTLIDGGVPVVAAAKLVGHSDSRVTERWYYDLTAQQRRSIQERMPS